MTTQLHMRRLAMTAFTLVAVLLGLPESRSPAKSAAGESPFPVRVSANGRYLEDARGKPFLLHGDTAWSLMVQLTKEETEEFLENRRQKGFNAILVNLIEKFYADNPPKNKYGDEPFTTPEDFATSNEKYFAHADWVIQKAGEKGILVVLNPCYTGFSPNFKTARDGWVQAVLANGPEKCRDYGRYIGRRYKHQSNIIWQAGGDTTIPVGSDLEKNWLEILRGIKAHGPDHPWTAHWLRHTTALDQATFGALMDIDNAYGLNRSYVQTLRAYNRTPPKPTFYNEGYYEDTALNNTGVGTAQQMRAQAYWALLSGATGHIFGSDHLWMFGGPRGTPANPKPRLDWRAGMDRQPSQEMFHVKRLFESRAWQNLMPDQDHTVVTKGFGTFGKDDRTPGGDYVTAARTGDGCLVMAYVPSTGNTPRTITVDMAKLDGPATARWFNPTSGTYTAIAGAPLANTGSREFTTPGDNGTGTNDWVLVLESASLQVGRSELEAQSPFQANYDESKVPSYQLPDPLVLRDGERVTDVATWMQKRRPEILELFRSEMFGRRPQAPVDLKFKVFDETPGALGGKATRKQVTIYFSADEAGPRMDVLLYLPAKAKQPVPAFLGLNFGGNHAVHADPGIKLSSSWMRPNKEKGVVGNKATEASRGSYANRWDVDAILDRGYALATAYYGDIDPDFDDGFKNGVHPLFYKAGQTKPASDEWGSIAAWAWGLSRALDYLERDAAIDAKRVAVMGHSRLGKTALWAGAEDERFAIVISNNSGCGGAALSRREFGETVRRINSIHPPWFCDNFAKFNDRVNELPVDQHMLIALMAPRPIYVASAEKDRWSDPRGEFLSALHAEPVYRLFGAAGLGVQDMPPLDQPAMGTIGYHIRRGVHDVTPFDWKCYLDFADRHFGRKMSAP